MQRDVRVEQIVCDVWRFVCAVLRKLLRFENHVLAMENMFPLFLEDAGYRKDPRGFPVCTGLARPSL